MVCPTLGFLLFFLVSKQTNKITTHTHTQGTLWYVDDPLGRPHFNYKGKPLSSMFFFQFGNEIFTKPTAVQQKIRGVPTGFERVVMSDKQEKDGLPSSSMSWRQRGCDTTKHNVNSTSKTTVPLVLDFKTAATFLSKNATGWVTEQGNCTCETSL